MIFILRKMFKNFNQHFINLKIVNFIDKFTINEDSDNKDINFILPEFI